MGTTGAVGIITSDGARLGDGMEAMTRIVRAKCVRLLPGALALVGILGCTWISFRLSQNLASVGSSILFLWFWRPSTADSGRQR